MAVVSPVRALGQTRHQNFWRSTCPLLQFSPNLRLCSGISKGSGSVTYLRSSRTGAELYLVGTAHISAKSAEEVRQVINQVRPNTVAVELCADRAKRLMSENEYQPNLFQFLREIFNFPGGIGNKIVHFALKSVYDLLRSTGVEPGKEFKVAIEEAQKTGANIIFMDQDVKVTVQRLSDVITLKDVLKYCMGSNPMSDKDVELLKEFENGNLDEAVERLKTRETVRKLIQSMEALFPDIVKVIVHERDQLMVDHLRNCPGRVVGVVGMAHMDGIEKLWKQLES